MNSYFNRKIGGGFAVLMNDRKHCYNSCTVGHRIGKIVQK